MSLDVCFSCCRGKPARRVMSCHVMIYGVQDYKRVEHIVWNDRNDVMWYYIIWYDMIWWASLPHDTLWYNMIPHNWLTSTFLNSYPNCHIFHKKFSFLFVSPISHIIIFSFELFFSVLCPRMSNNVLSTSYWFSIRCKERLHWTISRRTSIKLKIELARTRRD